MSKKILIVDDEPDVLEFQKSYLQRHGYTVVTAVNFIQAIESMKKEMPDVVFCDVRLETDTTGLDILKEARIIKPGVVFYLITGYIDKDVEEKGRALGVTAILAKTIANAEFLKKIEETP